MIEIVLIEDDIYQTHLVRELLPEDKYHIRAIASGKEALAFVLENFNSIDLILLDYHIPEIDGISMLESFKENNIDVPVIFFTADYSIENAVKTMSLGAIDYIPKNIDFVNSVLLAIEKAGRLIQSNQERKTIEKALKESEERFRIIVETTRDGIFEINLLEKDFFVSPNIMKMLQYQPEQFPKNYNDWLQIIHNDDLTMVLGKYRMLLDKKNNFQTIEFRVKNGCGDFQWILQRIIILERDNYGNPYRFIGTHIDISELKNAEIKIKETNRQLTTLISNLPGVVYRCRVDYSITFEYIGNRIFEIAGYKPSELVNSPDMWVNEIIYPEDRSKVNFYMRDALYSRTGYDITYRIVNKQGDIVHLADHSKVIADNEKISHYLEGYISDISTKYTAEKEHRKNEMRLEALLELNQMQNADNRSIYDFILASSVKLTGSKIAYLVFIAPNKLDIEVIGWSENARKEYWTENVKTKFIINDLGILADAYKSGQAVIHNEFNDPIPMQKGIPVGQLEINRCMGIPIFENNNIVGILGVGNKLNDYNQTDVKQLSILIQEMMKILLKKSIEFALRESEMLKQLVLDNSLQAFILLDPLFNIVTFNRIANHRSMMLFREPLRNGKNFIDYFSTQRGYILSKLKKVISGETSTWEMLHQINDQKNYYQISAIPIIENNEIRYISWTSNDISDRKSVEEKIVYSENLYNTTINSIDEPILVIDKRLYIMLANQSLIDLHKEFKLTEYPVGKYIKEVYSFVSDSYISELIRILDSGNNKETEFSFEFKNKKYFYELKQTPVVQSDEITRIVVIARDVTDRKMIEKNILNTIIETEERERKRFSEDLHDELGAMLSTVKIYLNTLFGRNIDDAKRIDLIRLTNELIDQSIQNSKNIANNISPNIIKKFGLEAAVQSIIEKLNVAHDINIVFKHDAYEALNPEIELSLYRIIYELIHNTLKHAHATNISIALNKIRTTVELLYSDDGLGFDFDKIQKSSVGLGLQNINTRINAMNGFLQIENVSKGFSMKLLVPVN